MNTGGQAVLVLALGVLFLVTSLMAYDMLWKWPKQDGKVPFARFRRKPKNMAHEDPLKTLFCSNCGSRMIPHRGQYGFEALTGKPYLLSYEACPDWDEVAWKTTLRSASYRWGEPPRECQNRVFIPVAPTITHNGHVDGDVSTACKRCIIDMERAGIISHEDAQARLEIS